MPNLEELALCLQVIRSNMPLIDGSALSNDLLVHMPKLNKFSFYVHTMVLTMNSNYICASHDEFKRSFVAKIFPRVDSFVEDNRHTRCVYSCVYSLPYAFDFFYIFSGSFRGGTFESVEFVFVFGERAFEHEFFASISQSFPSLRKLVVRNWRSGKMKQHSSTPIAFPRLRILDVTGSHSDYAEQFLLKSRACVPQLAEICINYDVLAKVTNRFTVGLDQLNYNQSTTFVMDEDEDEGRVHPQHFRMYCPLL
mgnify:CR=1 FL=1